jgi:hypothetical protein
VAYFLSLTARIRQRSTATGRFIAAVVGFGIFIAAAAAPDFARNLVMLARLRAWTTSSGTAYTNLAPVAAWLLNAERADSYLQAQSAARAGERGDADAERAALARARALAPIAGHCSSQDAMLIEHLARPLLSAPTQPKASAFFAHTADPGTISQMRSLPFDDGPGDCMHVLTVAQADENGYAAMHARLPTQPGRRYRIDFDCYVTGRLKAEVIVGDGDDDGDGDDAGGGDIIAAIEAREAWTRIPIDFAATSSYVATVQVVARNGAGRIACRDFIAYDVTDSIQ